MFCGQFGKKLLKSIRKVYGGGRVEGLMDWNSWPKFFILVGD